MKKLLPLWMFLPIFLVLAACSDNSEDIDRYYATVSTPKVTTTTPTSLTVTASVTGDLNQIVKKGFCYSAAASVPTIKDHVVDADENFSASLSTLTSGTSYYIRAYVYCDSRYVYSEVVTATTESLSLDDELKNYVAPTYSDDYTSISDWSKPFVQLETTRGCFNTCAFCVSGGEKPVRTLSIESIRERLQLIHAHGIKNVRVLDRTFNYNPRRAKELLRLFLEFHPDIRFHLEIHPALLSEELKEELSLLPKGLLHLEAGIQSLREPVLEKSRRMGKLSDALDGLRFLCALPNMETHADLIAGLPLYHLHEIFEDVRTLAGYAAGEIQLESLKLLPGTEMRRRAEELGIKYSPLPPYEVLQTHEISVSELQTARQLSRLLDGFYNTPAWQALTRELILNDEQFLHRFLAYLTKANLIDQPMSLEKRGLILYEFCKQNYPEYQIQAAIAWIEAGMSLKKLPAEKVWTKRQIPPATWNIIYGEYKESLRLCFLPADEKGEHGYWFGFESEIQKASPVFKART